MTTTSYTGAPNTKWLDTNIPDGQGRDSERGIPCLADSATAQRILAQVQELSTPFGTQVEIAGNVGVITPT